jgi:hypothetical protein
VPTLHWGQGAGFGWLGAGLASADAGVVEEGGDGGGEGVGEGGQMVARPWFGR